MFTAPYERRDGWALNIMLVGNTLYLEEHLDPAQISEKLLLLKRVLLFVNICCQREHE
jgi:hypothetical protein